MSITICHISPMAFTEGNLGGGERYPLALAGAQSKYSRVRLLTFGRRRTKWTGPEGVEIDVVRRIGTLRGDPGNPLSARLPIEMIDCDVLHIHQPMSLAGDMAASFGKVLDKEVFVTDLGGRGFNFLWRLHRVQRFVDGNLAISDYAAGLLRSYGIPTWTIGAGVNLERFTPPASDEREGILCVARITPHKGQDLLIRAAPDNVKVTLVGQVLDVQYMQYLRRLAEGKRVIFRGALSDEELVREYQSAVVSVLPSTTLDYVGRSHSHPELLGLVLLEAMACGTPIIATDVGGPAEVVDESKNGFLVPDHRLDILSDRLRYVLDNPEAARKMGKWARQFVERRYSWDSVARKSIRMYERRKPTGT